MALDRFRVARINEVTGEKEYIETFSLIQQKATYTSDIMRAMLFNTTELGYINHWHGTPEMA